MLLQIDVQPHTAIASFLSNNNKNPPQPSPPPLYANLRTSSHHYHQSKSDDSRGVLLTVGRKNCDVTLEGDKCVSRSHCRLRLVSIHASQVDDEEGDGVPKACAPRNEEEKEACEGTKDGWIVVLEDLGSKFGTYILIDAPESNNQNKEKSSPNNQDDEDDDATDDEEMVENSLNPNTQSIPITMAMYQSSLLAGGNPPQPPPMDEDGTTIAQKILKSKPNSQKNKKQIVQKVETKQSLILTHLNNHQNKTILLLCGQNGSILKISRQPLHFTLSRLTTPIKNHLQTISPLIGATLHSTWEHLYSTHLVTPTATTTAKHLTAWCAKCPIVTPDYVEALYQRINIEDDLPRIEEYKAPGDTPMDEVDIGEDGVDLMRGYTILSLTENDEMVPLVQAAGCTCVISCSSYTDTASFAQFLEDTIAKSTQQGKKVIFVESKSRKCKKQRSVLDHRMKGQKDVWAVQPKDIASALSSFGKEGGGILVDIFGEKLTPLLGNHNDEGGNDDLDHGDHADGEEEQNGVNDAVDAEQHEEDVAIVNNDVHVIENDEHDDDSDNVNRATARSQRSSPPKRKRLADIQEVEGEDEADDSSPEGRKQKRAKSSPNQDSEEEASKKSSATLSSHQQKDFKKRKMDNDEGREVMDDDNATAITSTSASTRKGKKKKTSGWMSSTKRSTKDDTSSHKPALMTIKQDDDDNDDEFPVPTSPTSSSYHRPHHITSSSSPPKWKKILSKSKDGWYKTAPTGKIRAEQRNIAAAHWEKEMNDDSHNISSSNLNIIKMEDAAETEQRNDLIVRTDEEVRIWRHQMLQERKNRQRRKKGGKDVPDYRRFRKNVIIPGNSWCLNDDEDENDMSYANDDPNASRIRLRSVLPKESERQKQLEVSQRELEREQLAADALFNDGNGGGRGARGGSGNIRDFFRKQQKVKRSGGGSVASSSRRGRVRR